MNVSDTRGNILARYPTHPSAGFTDSGTRSGRDGPLTFLLAAGGTFLIGGLLLLVLGLALILNLGGRLNFF